MAFLHSHTWLKVWLNFRLKVILPQDFEAVFPLPSRLSCCFWEVHCILGHSYNLHFLSGIFRNLLLITRILKFKMLTLSSWRSPFSLLSWACGDLFLLDVLVLQFWKSLLHCYNDNFFLIVFLVPSFWNSYYLAIESSAVTQHYKKIIFLLLCTFFFSFYLLWNFSKLTFNPSIEFFIVASMFLFSKRSFLFSDYSSCSFYMEVIFFFNSLRILMIISLTFSCTQNCFIKMINLFVCLFGGCLLCWRFPPQNLCSKSAVQEPWTFWNISQGIVVLTPFTSCGAEIGSRVTTYNLNEHLHAHTVLSNLILTSTLWGKYYCYYRFPAEETEAQSGHVTWPGSVCGKSGVLGSRVCLLNDF